MARLQLSSLMLHVPQLLRDTGCFPSSRQGARRGGFSQPIHYGVPRGKMPKKQGPIKKTKAAEAVHSRSSDFTISQPARVQG